MSTIIINSVWPQVVISGEGDDQVVSLENMGLRGKEGPKGNDGDGIGEVGAAAFASLAMADAYAAPLGYTIVIADNWAVTANLTLNSRIRFALTGLLTPANGINVHLKGGYDGGIWRKCFDLSLGGSVTGDRGHGFFVTPNHFGASALADPETNRRAFQAAFDYSTLNPIRDEYASSMEVLIPPVTGNYKIGGDLIWRRNMLVRGTTPHGRSSGVSKLVFTAACVAGIFFQSPGGSSAPSPYDTELGANAWGAGRSVFQDIHLEAETAGAVDFGIVHNIPVNFDRVSVQDFRLAGFFAHGQSSGNSDYGDPTGIDGNGTMYGNTNGSLYNRCLARDTTEGHGFVAQGNNTQIMTYLNCDASGNAGCGFRDNSSIGNHYIGCHSAQNTIKVSYNGAFYMPIKPHTATAESEPGIGVDWKRYWLPITATTADDTWAIGKSFRDAGGYNVVPNSGSYPMFLGCYSEGGVEYGCIPRSSYFAAGGNITSGRIYSEGPDATSGSVANGSSATPRSWSGTDGTYGWGSSLGATRTSTVLYQTGHTHDTDVAIAGKSGLSIQYSQARNSYEFLKGLSGRFLAFTTDAFVKGNYSGKHLFAESGILLGDGGSGATRVRSAASLAAITGDVKRGTVFLYQNPTAGSALGARVVTGGTVGGGAVLEEIYPAPAMISVGPTAPVGAPDGSIWIDTA